MRRMRVRHAVLPALVLVCLTAIVASPCAASHHRIEKGALIGGGAGLLFGDGLGGVLKGAVIGGAVGAYTTPGPEGRDRRHNARKGALIGAGAGLVFGHSLGSVLEGGLLGGAAGALLGKHHHH